MKYELCTSGKIHNVLINKSNYTNKKDRWVNMNDKNAITSTILNYIEGWYEGNSERMSQALHPSLIKRIFENGEMRELGYELMMNFTVNGGGKNVPKETYNIEVNILDINNNIATAVSKSEYIDYIHLVKLADGWKIVNVLWDFNR